jgi:hypothetical protein
VKLIFTASLIVLGVVLQGTLLYRALPGGVTLDFALLFTLLAAWRRGSTTALFVGLWGGALVGTALGALVPLMAVLYGLVGWTTGRVVRLMGPRTLWRAALLGATMLASLQGLENIALVISHQQVTVEPASLAWSLLWHGLFLASLVALADFHLLKRLRGRFERSKPWETDSAFLAASG